MSQTSQANSIAAEEPLKPAYPFNKPGQSVRLYEGTIGGLGTGERVGTVELSCQPKHGLYWATQEDDSFADPRSFTTDLGAISLCLKKHNSDWIVDAHSRSARDGWINVAEFERPGAQLDRVLLHWMNVPNIRGSVLSDSSPAGQRLWAGRWRADIDGWSITMDVRPDFSEAMEGAHTTHLYLLTHVMQIRRVNGESFDPRSVETLVECLRVTFSFAFGRWVAPALRIGYEATGQVAWEVWTSPLCDPARRNSVGWLYTGNSEDLTNLVQCAFPAFNDEQRSGITRHQMYLAIQSMESGFLEQRILSAAPALEHLAWADLVLGGRMSGEEYRDRYAEDRLRFLLEQANVPTDIDTDALPALGRFAREEHIDGPTAVTRVRNRLIHPQNPQDQIYRHTGLVRDTWLLTRHYVTLLILHSIGYQGSYTNLARLGGWAGDTEPVPWAVQDDYARPKPSLPPSKRSVRSRNRKTQGGRQGRN